MPYYPGKQIVVMCMENLAYDKNGDFDTVWIKEMVVNDEKVEINRYFAESRDYKDCSMEEYIPGWIEISKTEYDLRIKKADKLKEKLSNNAISEVSK